MGDAIHGKLTCLSGYATVKEEAHTDYRAIAECTDRGTLWRALELLLGRLQHPAPYFEGFGRFATSTTGPMATGWSGSAGGAPICQLVFGPRRAVKCPVAQHGEQHVASAPCEGNEGLIVSLPLTDLAGVVGPGERIAQRLGPPQDS